MGKGRLQVVESPDVPTPVLHGLVRPKLVLPAGFATRFSAEELRFIFLHELAHVKRRDIAMNWLVAVLQVIHWFNPLVWLGFARWRADRELACDALALDAAGPDQNREYGRTILRLLESLTPRVAAPGLVGILEDHRQLKQRLQMIASYRPARRWGIWSVLLLAGLAVVCLTDAQSPKSNPTGATVTNISTNTPSEEEAREVRRGQDPALSGNETNLEAREIVVTVLDAATGMPLAGAEVFAPYTGDWRRPKRLTDQNGKFAIRFLLQPAGLRRQMSNFSISASHPKYATRSVMWTSSGGDVYEGLPSEFTLKMERGIPIGGTVLDDRGQPLAGVRVLLSGSGYRGFTMGGNERRTHEYSEIYQTAKQLPAAVTDDAGRWTFAHFPGDLSRVEATFVRPDDSQEVFATDGEEHPLNRRPPISLAELKATNATVRLPEGVTVRGLVMDDTGKPVAGATVKEGYGHGNIVRVAEFQTDANGRFERPHRVPRQWIYTATAPGRATVSVVAQVEAGMPDVRIVLPPANLLKLWATDDAGQPLAEVAFTIDTHRTEGQLLDWSGTTDPNGLAVWTNPPTAPVTLYAGAKALGAMRKVKVAAGETEKRVVLSKTAAEKITVRIRAVDAETRQPVKVQAVSARYESIPSSFKRLEGENTTAFVAEIRRTDFRVGMYPSYELKVDAEGYESLTTEQIDFDLGDQELELALTRSGGASQLQVLTPEGKPAAGAKLWVRATSDAGESLFMNAPGRYHGDRLAKEQASDDGHVKLPGVPADAPVIITHTNGFLAMPMAALKRSPEVHLQPYGAVKGRLLVAGKPKEGVNVSLGTLNWSPALGFHLGLTATTEQNGRFTFTQVPPGEFKLYQWAMPKTRRGSGGAIIETWQMPVTVRPGETSTVEYASAGRVVIGQAKPDRAELAVDWQNDVHVLSLKLPDAPAEARPNREDFATFAAFIKAHNASFQSPARLKQAREARAYQLSIEEDGSFRVEDVPPGTYELRIRVTKPEESSRRSPMMSKGEELALLVREVVVPEGKEALDLGTLTVPVTGNADVVVKHTPPVRLQARTLDGQPLMLEQFKGRNVLLVFWTSWSERSTEQLDELAKLRNELGPDVALTLVGVSLDEDAASARKAVEARGYRWTQGWLDAKGRAQAAAAFDVKTLPAVFLLDAEGRVVARDLQRDRLPVAVKRQLAKK